MNIILKSKRSFSSIIIFLFGDEMMREAYFHGLNNGPITRNVSLAGDFSAMVVKDW